jgi:hypothetical protein
MSRSWKKEEKQISPAHDLAETSGLTVLKMARATPLQPLCCVLLERLKQRSFAASVYASCQQDEDPYG